MDSASSDPTGDQHDPVVLASLMDFVERMDKTAQRLYREGGSRFERTLEKIRDLPEADREAELKRYLDWLFKAMNVAVSSSYRDAIQQWAEGKQKEFEPEEIRERAGVSEWMLGLGLGYRSMWRVYCTRIETFTPIAVVDEIDSVVGDITPQ